jgi:hypothetical protein
MRVTHHWAIDNYLCVSGEHHVIAHIPHFTTVHACVPGFRPFEIPGWRKYINSDAILIPEIKQRVALCFYRKFEGQVL